MRRNVVFIDDKLAAGEFDLDEILHYCQVVGCQQRPTRLCLCGCERQLCDDHEEAEHLARQVRYARNILRHRAEARA